MVSRYDNKDDLLVTPEVQNAAPTGMSWPAATRQLDSSPTAWRAGEAAEYRGLLTAAQSLTRFGERLALFPQDVGERFALLSVSAMLHGEGVWLRPDRIALYRALRIGADDAGRDLARANWAIRRLSGSSLAGPLDGVQGFLGRNTVQSSQAMGREFPGDDRPQRGDAEALGDQWVAAVEGVQDLHPLTQGAFAFHRWREQELTPFDEILEPGVAVMRIGAVGLAPFLPQAEGRNIGRLPGGGTVRDRLRCFYSAVETGSLKALMDLGRLTDWQARAVQQTACLSGRIPPLLIDALLRLPVVSAELVAATLSCSRPAARRNLDLLVARGLIREVTGQDRYRFWTVQL